MRIVIGRALSVLGAFAVVAGASAGLANRARRETGEDLARLSSARDCGAVSLYVICWCRGERGLSLEYLRALCETDVYGASLLRVKQAAQHLGFDVSARLLDVRHLRRSLQAGTAAILYLPAGHFVPVLGLSDDGRFVAFSTTHGPLFLSRRELVSVWEWRGVALLLRPDSAHVTPVAGRT